MLELINVGETRSRNDGRLELIRFDWKNIKFVKIELNTLLFRAFHAIGDWRAVVWDLHCRHQLKRQNQIHSLPFTVSTYVFIFIFSIY